MTNSQGLGKLRNECLNENSFASLAEAQRGIEQWRHEYNSSWRLNISIAIDNNEERPTRTWAIEPRTVYQIIELSNRFNYPANQS